ncbi:NAD(P)/FAD-dependent oxidoreductase [Rhodoferax ferrireducens]|uniref:FAD/NAD(P)-dependent oxidoreductase n=1 Tax=Rhodoferax ferrireducens TaxID=192843 RepID=UPI000E0D9031|nr:FAD/NAD(P)-binding oxidoreductase [Rhodoferax ferrireducens]
MAQPRVIIVGAGPSGVRCAQTLVAAGLRPIVIDENRRDGGQIYRRQPDNFTRPYAKLYGTVAASAQALHESFDALRDKIDYWPETLAWNISDKKLNVVKNERTSALPYDALVICSGATDRLMPVKGWQFAGTYSLGASQIALKAQACAIGRQVVFMGTGPLLYLVASQYVKAGAKVAAVLDTSPLMRRVAALPKLLARPKVLIEGLRLVAGLKRAGVPVLTGVTPLEITGSADNGVQGVTVRDGRGKVRSFDCDAVAMGYHLRPETQLADLARCAFRFDQETRQWLPELGEDGRSSVPGVYLAGDGVRVLGADGAEIGGRLAAMAVLKDFHLKVDDEQLQQLRRAQASMDRFRRGLVQAFPWPAKQAAELPDEAIVCRCEAVTAGELRRVVCEMGAQEANRAKAFSRVGMGRCQGRYCANAGAEVIAHAAGVPVELVGRLRGQAPVKPLSLAVREEDQ